MHRNSLILIWLVVLASCSAEHKVEGLPTDRPFVLDYPQGFPEMQIPTDNAMTEFRVDLGRRLFFDTRLSSSNTVSCASCHLPSRAFADLSALSVGVDGAIGKRNATSLANSGYQDRLNMDGGVPSLELQVLVPLHDENELNFNNLDLIEKLRNDPVINRLSHLAYERDFDTFVVTRALAAYERTLLSGNSRYDQYLRGELELSSSELNGEALFFSDETQCSSCHSGFLFSDQNYANIGLYEVYADEGRRLVTGDEDDIGKFKTPSLRNVGVTDPYMHDGSLASLSDVLAFLNEGGFDHVNKDARIQPLGLSPEELADLEAFLHTLTDDDFLTEESFLPQ